MAYRPGWGESPWEQKSNDAKYDPMHYSDVIMSAMASQIAGVSSVYSPVCSGADQRGIHQEQMNSPHKGPVTPKMSPFDDVIMNIL